MFKIFTNEKKLEQRVRDVCDKYNALVDNASTEQEKEILLAELNHTRRLIYFGAEMKKHREFANKTQEQFAEEIGKSKSYVKKVEAGIISLRNKPEIVDKIVENLNGWSRHQAYNMLEIKYEHLSETISLTKAKKSICHSTCRFSKCQPIYFASIEYQN